MTMLELCAVESLRDGTWVPGPGEVEIMRRELDCDTTLASLNQRSPSNPARTEQARRRMQDCRDWLVQPAGCEPATLRTWAPGWD